MFQRIIFSAAIAGLLSGFLVTLFQQIWITPLIRNAEKYELKAVQNLRNDHHKNHTDKHILSKPIFKTFIANTITSISFALLMISSGGFVKNFDTKRGFFWGIAGFIIFSLMPSIAIAPKLPGDMSLPISEHNLLWLLTTTCSAIGLLLIVFSKKNSMKFLGFIILFLPHLASFSISEFKLVGDLKIIQGKFHTIILITSLIYWSFLGTTSGYFFKKLNPN